MNDSMVRPSTIHPWTGTNFSFVSTRTAATVINALFIYFLFLIYFKELLVGNDNNQVTHLWPQYLEWVCLLTVVQSFHLIPGLIDHRRTAPSERDNKLTFNKAQENNRAKLELPITSAYLTLCTKINVQIESSAESKMA